MFIRIKVIEQVRSGIENPGITNQELAEAFRLDKSTVHWHAHKFLADGMIRFEKEGRYLKYCINEDSAADTPCIGGARVN